MKSAITTKLHRLLEALPIVEEAHVVYLLVEIRKLVEHDGRPGTLRPSLALYCDWVVHTKLAGQGAQNFIKLIYPFLEWRDGDDQDAHRNFIKALSFGSLRDELGTVFQEHSLPTALVDDDSHWSRFLLSFAEVIADCPLVVTPTSLPATPQVLSIFPFQVSRVAIEARSPTQGWQKAEIIPMKWNISYHKVGDPTRIAEGTLTVAADGLVTRSFSM